ncbi:ASPIC/UnbV domain-containing protein [Acidobacteria bacterium AH-259-D05]|nr:ASPIC/UnbV domain-containing protein [Acidobacteria bacterium AH-259-D05]
MAKDSEEETPKQSGNEEEVDAFILRLKPLVQGGLSFSGYERDALYLNLGTKRYLDISGISGIDSITDGRAAVYADFDNDGDLDVFLVTIQGPSQLLFRNNVGQNNSWIRVSLEGKRSGRDAFGTIVRVKSSTGIQTKVKTGGEGYLSQHDPRLLFGLGSDTHIDWLEVVWPTGLKQRFENITAGTHLRISEGQDQFTIVSERRANLPDPLPSEELQLRTLKVRKGQAFPDIEVSSLREQKGRFRSFISKGKRTLVNLWATWCTLCVREVPELERLRPQLQDEGIEVVGLSLDREGPEVVEEYLKKHGISYPVFLAGENTIEQIYDVSDVWVPLTLLIDERGNVIEMFAGPSKKVLGRVEHLTKR